MHEKLSWLAVCITVGGKEKKKFCSSHSSTTQIF